MKRLVTMAAGLLAVGLLAGCSGSGSDAAPVTVELSSTTSSTAAPTTTSTSEATTTTVDPNIALVEAAAEGYYTYTIVYGVTVDEEALQAVAADPLLSTVRSTLARWEDEGSTLGADEYDFVAVDVSVSGDSAVVISCSLGGASLLDSAGQVLIPTDDVRYLREAQLVLTDVGWRVFEVGYAGEEKSQCDV